VISLDRNALVIRGERLPLYSGTVHYWRLDRTLWPRILDRVAELGFRFVESYIPWSVHELRPGHFDFGQYDPRKDVGAFLDLVAERGMYFFARPGPHINAEITYFGYPKRLFEDPELLSVSATGSPVAIPVPPRAFPALSYASEKFYREFAVYLDALAPILAGRQQPDGPVVGIQADNEMSFFFRTAAYDHDYSPAARAQYSRFLAAKYGSAQGLSDAYGRRYEHFDQVPMPRRFAAEQAADLPYYLDWMEYKEHALLDPLRTIATMFRERGLTRVLTTHNYPTTNAHSPFNIGETEKDLDVVGIDFYLRRTEARALRDRTRALAGRSRLPFVPEFGAGCFLWSPPTTVDDERFTVPYALMQGVRAINFYMIVERERWYGSPITRTGEPREPNFSFFRDLLALLNRLDLAALPRVCDVAVCRVRDYDRLEKAASLFSPLPPLFTDFVMSAEAACDERALGLSRCVQIEHDVQGRAWSTLLDRAGVPFDLTDTDVAGDRLARYRLLIAPTFEFASRRAQEALLTYAFGGGTLVVGPDVPERDERMADLRVLGERMKLPTEKLLSSPTCVSFDHGRGRIVLVSAPLPAQPQETGHWSGPLLARLVDLAGARAPFVPADQAVETTLFADGAREVLFVANPTAVPRTADLPADGAARFVDAWTGTVYRADDRVAIDAPPYTVRILEVRR
jgi:beta-galactosidase